MDGVDLRFRVMGCDARLQLEGDGHDLDTLAAALRLLLEEVEATLSRFRADSELRLVNADPRPAVPVSPLFARFVVAAGWAARMSQGLVDVTLAGALRDQGYVDGWDPARRAGLDLALAAAPARRPAGRRPGGVVPALDADGRLVRPPGVALDPGGLGKGLAADLVLEQVPDGVRAAIALGGDVAVRGTWPVIVEDARDGRDLERLRVADGAVATSGIQARLWRRADGRFAHHVLDPATGEPAWTGLLAATAVGRGGVEAEVLAKTALLRGPLGGRRVVRRLGGVLQPEHGPHTLVTGAPVVRLPVGA